MKRFIALVCLGLPLLIVATGVYVIVGTPEIMTEVIEYRSSHGSGYMLLLIGAVFATLGALIVWDEHR